MKVNLSPRALGCIGALLVLLVIGIEGTLTILRQRTITAAIRVVSDYPTPTPTATGAPTLDQEATPDPQVTALTMADDGTVTVSVVWNYTIGPRFPLTTVHAIALDAESQIVAASQYVIDCGQNTLTCDGTTTLTLVYGVIAATSEWAGTGTPAPLTPTPPSNAAAAWLPGAYTIVVTREYSGFDAVELTRQNIFVASGIS